MIEIIKKEMRNYKKSLIGYLIGSFFLLWLYVLIYPSIHDASAQLQQVFDAYPKEVMAAFEINDLNFDTLEKYIGAEHFSFVWPIMAIVLAMSRAGNYFAGEIEKGTIGLSLSLPISRIKLFLAKYIAGMLNLLIFVFVSVFGIIPLAIIHGQDFHTKLIFQSAILCLFFAAAIFSISTMLSAISSEKSKVYFPITVILLAMYVMNIVANIKPSLDWLQYGSAFHYFNIQDVLANFGMSIGSIIVFSIAILFSCVVGAFVFNKRDIAA